MRTPRSGLSPAARLALLPARGPERRAEAAALLTEPLDWKELVALADRERSALPVWRLIRDSGYRGSEVGPRILRELARVWEFKLMHLERLFIEALGALDEAGIEVVVLKGAAASLTTYGGFGTRPMVDVDLLVEREQARPAWLRMREIGWRWNARLYPEENYQAAHQHLPPLTDGFGAGVGMEIHTALWLPGAPFALDLADVRRDAVTVRANGRSIRVPSPAHQLLHCCVHFAWSHRMASHAWRAFSDVDAFVASGTLDWDAFAALARRTGAATCCYWTLRLARVVADVPVPEAALAAMRPTGPDFVLDRLERHFVLDLIGAEDACPSLALRHRLWSLAVQKGRAPSSIELPSTPPRAGVMDRFSHHGRRLTAWGRYLGRML